MTVPIPPPITRRPPPPDPRASSTFSLSLRPCQSIYLVIVAGGSPAFTNFPNCDASPDCCGGRNHIRRDVTTSSPSPSASAVTATLLDFEQTSNIGPDH